MQTNKNDNNALLLFDDKNSSIIMAKDTIYATFRNPFLFDIENRINGITT